MLSLFISFLQGYLLERSAVKMLVPHTWSREWFVLDDSKLYMIKEKERGERDTGSSLDVQVNYMITIMIVSIILKLTVLNHII